VRHRSSQQPESTIARSQTDVGSTGFMNSFEIKNFSSQSNARILRRLVQFSMTDIFIQILIKKTAPSVDLLSHRIHSHIHSPAAMLINL
jgi:hypothetical protein